MSFDGSDSLDLRFRAMADASPVMVWLSGVDKHCTWFNKLWLQFAGRTMEDEIGEGWTQRVHPDDLERCLYIYTTSFDARRAFEMDYRLRRHDGSYRWILDAGSPFQSETGTFAGYIGSCIDIDDRKTADAKLLEHERRSRVEAERASQTQDDFLARLLHELRTPLNAIILWTQILDQSRDTSTLDEGIGVIQQNARLQARLIDDLLDVGRIASGRLRLGLHPVDLADICSAVVASAQPAASAQGVELVKSLTPDVGPTVGDRARLQQVFGHLLANAIKFTPAGGRIQVTLRRAAEEAMVIIADNGQGIAPHVMAHLFSRSPRPQSVQKSESGLGLGLSIVKNLVELHGGSIEVESDGPGRGATFTIRLPIQSSRTVHGMPVAVAPRTTPLDLGGRRLLVVDDDNASRVVIRRILQRYGAIVDVAERANDALAILKGTGADLILSDIGMPERDGYSLIREVRRLGYTMPAIALTAFVTKEDRARALDAGFQVHLPKPVDIDQLLAAIEHLLSAQEK